MDAINLRAVTRHEGGRCSLVFVKYLARFIVTPVVAQVKTILRAEFRHGGVEQLSILVGVRPIEFLVSVVDFPDFLAARFCGGHFCLPFKRGGK